LSCGAVAVGIIMMVISVGTNRRFAMSALRPLALGMLVWAAMDNVVRADAITWPSNYNWVTYFAGQNGSDGGTSAPVSTSVAPTQPSQPAAITIQPPLQPPAPAPAPVPAQAVVANVPTMQAPAPTYTPTISAPASAPTSGPVDAFINLGNGPYPLQSAITTGNAQPWYSSSQITNLFGGPPSIQQIQSFDNTILQRVQQTFNQSGVNVTLTDNPGVAALHTLSLVSNTSAASLPSAIGMTQVGANGFSFIDHIASSAQSIDQLEWIVAHNISHELMLAFGVPENYDTTGNFVDARTANWAMMVSPTSTFSTAASQALDQALAAQNSSNLGSQLGAQLVGSESPVPEPTTIALWTAAGAAIVIAKRRKSRLSNATR
jgi:hypothetical protein